MLSLLVPWLDGLDALQQVEANLMGMPFSSVKYAECLVMDGNVAN